MYLFHHNIVSSAPLQSFHRSFLSQAPFQSFLSRVHQVDHSPVSIPRFVVSAFIRISLSTFPSGFMLSNFLGLFYLYNKYKLLCLYTFIYSSFSLAGSYMYLSDLYFFFNLVVISCCSPSTSLLFQNDYCHVLRIQFFKEYSN